MLPPQGSTVPHGTVIPPQGSVVPHGTISTPYGPGTIVTPYGTGTVLPSTPAGNKPPEAIKKMPADNKGKVDNKENNSASVVAPAQVTPAAAKIETEAKNPFELDRRYEMRVSHAADYSRLTGQLFFVHADGGLWVLRYAPLSREDVNGGSVILARDRQMNNYREGDLVTVEGQIISKKGSSRLGAPLYRAQTIRLVDRPE